MDELEHKRKGRRGIYLLPNLFTTANLFAGFYAVIASMQGRFEPAAIAIFAAMLLDGIDGWVARLTQTQSDFGAEYDSLADMVAFGVALLSYAIADPGMITNTAFATGLFTFEFTSLGLMPAISMVLLSMLLAYIPLTHMSHFIGKYFAYHAIRWNDEPNMPGGAQEKKIGKMLNQPVTWAAPHIQGDGKTTWADVATKDTAENE